MDELTEQEKATLLADYDRGRDINEELLRVIQSIPVVRFDRLDGAVRRTIVLYSETFMKAWFTEPLLNNAPLPVQLQAMHSTGWIQGYMAAMEWGKPLTREVPPDG